MTVRGIILTTLLLPFGFGCDIFQTREPEQPTQNTSTFDQPITPETVLRNFQYAIQEYNIDNYMRCFVDPAFRSFDFISSQEVRANFASVFDQWNLESERRYFQNLGTPVDGTPLLTFSSQQIMSVSSDSVTYNMNYLLFFPHRKVNTPTVVQGNMQLSLKVDLQHRWSIYRWEDFKTTTDSTWSILKAVLSG